MGTDRSIRGHVGWQQQYHPLDPPPAHRETAAGSERMSPWLEERLFDRRIVVLNGTLTALAASQAAAAMLTLDAMGDDPVQLFLSAPDGLLPAAFALVDAIETMRAPVHATITAEVGGGAVAVLAAAGRRLAYRHARIRLVEPHAEVGGTTDQVTAAAGQYLRELEELVLQVAAVTGWPRSQVEHDLSVGRILTAEQARECGLIHDIVGPAKDIG